MYKLFWQLLFGEYNLPSQASKSRFWKRDTAVNGVTFELFIDLW